MTLAGSHSPSLGVLSNVVRATLAILSGVRCLGRAKAISDLNLSLPIKSFSFLVLVVSCVIDFIKSFVGLRLTCAFRTDADGASPTLERRGT